MHGFEPTPTGTLFGLSKVTHRAVRIAGMAASPRSRHPFVPKAENSMRYVVQRLLTFPLILLGVSMLVFFAIRLVPGDAITAMLGTEAGLLTADQRASLAAYFGIDQPCLVQYWRWLGGLLHGDLGISVTYGKPVLDVILERFPLTLELALLSMIIALAVGVPAGVFAATHNEKLSDLVVRLFAMLGQSTPSFVLRRC